MHAFDLALHGVGRLLVGGDDRQRTDALAVQAEVLRERAADDQLRARPGERLQADGVLVDAVGKALVGEVQQRQDAARVDRVGQLLPLLGRRVDAGRVVAAAVQQDDVAGRNLLDRRQCAPSNARLFVLASKYGKLFVGTPAAAKICGWFGQVGCVIQTVALGNC